jgi:hypothetical protein
MIHPGLLGLIISVIFVAVVMIMTAAGVDKDIFDD